jgi:hypothetical protein
VNRRSLLRANVGTGKAGKEPRVALDRFILAEGCSLRWKSKWTEPLICRKKLRVGFEIRISRFKAPRGKQKFAIRTEQVKKELT